MMTIKNIIVLFVTEVPDRVRQLSGQTLWGTIISLALLGCQPDTETPKDTEKYRFTVPANFPSPVYQFENNPVTEDGFELGRMLFFDPRLSVDGSVSCATCHRQTFAFADHSHDLSHGVNGKLGTRNTPGIANLAWQREFFWDGGVNHIEITPLNALTNPAEMGETLENVIRKIEEIPEYREKFKAAFGKDTINSQLFFRALAQFSASLISATSRYDRYVRKENGIVFRPEEEEGLQLFKAKCASCHATDLFTDQSYRNNGLDNQFTDQGREIISRDPSDIGKFRVPSLRNVALTGPYMHDGRFYTLDRVLDHYDSGVKDSPSLDPLLKQNGRLGIPLTEDEKTKLLAFLNTLTDPAFCSDTRFRDPFNNPEGQ